MIKIVAVIKDFLPFLFIHLGVELSNMWHMATGRDAALPGGYNPSTDSPAESIT